MTTDSKNTDIKKMNYALGGVVQSVNTTSNVPNFTTNPYTITSGTSAKPATAEEVSTLRSQVLSLEMQVTRYVDALNFITHKARVMGETMETLEKTVQSLAEALAAKEKMLELDPTLLQKEMERE